MANLPSLIKILIWQSSKDRTCRLNVWLVEEERSTCRGFLCQQIWSWFYGTPCSWLWLSLQNKTSHPKQGAGRPYTQWRSHFWNQHQQQEAVWCMICFSDSCLQNVFILCNSFAGLEQLISVWVWWYMCPWPNCLWFHSDSMVTKFYYILTLELYGRTFCLYLCRETVESGDTSLGSSL